MLKSNFLAAPYRMLFGANGYPFFDDPLKPYRLNLFGIRSAERSVTQFNDYLFCVYWDADHNFRVHQWVITTDAGLKALLNPVNWKGCAIMVPGYYPQLWTIRPHKGKYEALGQVGNVHLYRDNNRDAAHTFDPSTIETGSHFGINCHKAGEDTKDIGPWSYGCQVFKRSKDFYELMVLARRHRARYGNSFNYTLFSEIPEDAKNARRPGGRIGQISYVSLSDSEKTLYLG